MKIIYMILLIFFLKNSFNMDAYNTLTNDIYKLISQYYYTIPIFISLALSAILTDDQEKEKNIKKQQYENYLEKRKEELQKLQPDNKNSSMSNKEWEYHEQKIKEEFKHMVFLNKGNKTNYLNKINLEKLKNEHNKIFPHKHIPLDNEIINSIAQHIQKYKTLSKEEIYDPVLKEAVEKLENEYKE